MRLKDSLALYDDPRWLSAFVRARPHGGPNGQPPAKFRQRTPRIGTGATSISAAGTITLRFSSKVCTRSACVCVSVHARPAPHTIATTRCNGTDQFGSAGRGTENVTGGIGETATHLGQCETIRRVCLWCSRCGYWWRDRRPTQAALTEQHWASLWCIFAPHSHSQAALLCLFGADQKEMCIVHCCSHTMKQTHWN